MKQPVTVLGQQWVPVRSPDNLDHVPAGSAERRLEFLDDLSIAADRAVEALQVAVDDPGQVIELFTGGEGESAQGFRLVRFAVPDVTPDPRFVIGINHPTGAEVTEKPRLVNRHDRPEPHGYRGKLPEIRHQVRVRIRRQPAAVREFLAKMLEIVLVQSSFEKRPRVGAW